MRPDIVIRSFSAPFSFVDKGVLSFDVYISFCCHNRCCRYVRFVEFTHRPLTDHVHNTTFPLFH